MDTVSQNKRKMKVAISSVIAAVFLTTIKLVFAILTGSLGLLSEFAHSGLDLFAALVTVFSIKISNKPADKEHQYGHGKVENLSAIAQVGILFITCGYIIYEAITRLFLHTEYHLEITIWAYVVMFTSIIVDISRSRILKKVADETRSQALEADALHFSTDIWSASVVILGLLLVSLNISKAADAIAALFVSVIVIYISYKLLKRAIDQLMDKVPEGLYEKISKEVKKIDGVEDIKILRLRESGAKIFIDMTIYIDRTLLFQKVHDIMDNVENKINELVSNSDITIHSEPIESKKETLIDKTRLIVERNGLKCHDIFTYELDNANNIELDIEYPADDNFKEAHKVITKIENEIYDEVKEINKLIIHIDEPSDLIIKSKNVTEENCELVSKVEKLILSYKEVHDCSDINIMDSENKFRITLVCIFPEELSFRQVHRLVHKMESEIYRLSEDIGSVLIHAEPLTTANGK